MRVFTGLPLPAAAIEALESWTAGWRRSFPRLAWVAPQLLHVSLRFFGEISGEQAEALAADLAGLRASAIRCRAGEVGRFPPGGSHVQPRVIFVALERGSAEVAALQAAYAARIARLGYGAEDRAFVPHLTLARVRSRRSGRGGEEGAGGFERIEGSAGIDFVFDRIVLYESVLRPGGPEYRPLRSVELEAS